MAARLLQLVGLATLMVAANAASAQTVNPITTLTVPQTAEVPISPSTPGTNPGTLNNETTGTNPITGLPCSGAGALAVSGAGGLSDSATPPPGSTSATPQLPTLQSVFGSPSTLGSC